MFNIGDLIIYSAHGICHIDDICEESYSGGAQNYYVLHPLENNSLKISTPVDNDKVLMLRLINSEEAEEIIESFKLPGIDWIEISSHRIQTYSEIVKKGNRKDISKIINTFMRKKHKAEIDGKKLYQQDIRLLESTQNILFRELAMSLNTTFEVIYEKINSLINENAY